MDEAVKVVKDILNSLGMTGLAKHAELILFFILGSGTVVLARLWKILKSLLKLRKQRRLTKDLHPFFTPVEIKKATQYYVATRCQNSAPSKEDEPSRTHSFAASVKIIPFFLKRGFKDDDNEDRYHIVLADSGMGKTTFMINLYLKYVSQWWGKAFKIKLFPLGYPKIDEELDKIEDDEKDNTILLLDAFDEDTEAVKDYKQRMDEILRKTYRFRKVVITCRTQFFPSEEEEPGETGILKYGGEKGVHIFRKMYLSPFDEKDIKKYLGKKFSIFSYKKKKRARQIVKQSPNLMVRPMLLSYIDDLLESNRKYEYSYQVYEELIDKWIEREARHLPVKERRENYKEELFTFSRVVVLDIYRSREKRDGLFIHRDDIESFAKKHGIQLKHMEMKSRSLLNRNASSQYKFSHKSILEYFLALLKVKNYEFYKKFSFEGMEQARSFYSDMWEKYTFEFLIQKNLKGEYGVRGLGVKDLSEIKFNELESLNYLDLSSNQLTVISPLKELKKICKLDLSNNQLIDIRPLKELKELWGLNLSNNQLSDISPLKELKKLVVLELNKNQLIDISPLKELKKLKFLFLSDNKLTDTRPLSKLKNLRILVIGRNPVPGDQIEALKKALPGCRIYSR